MPGDFVASTQEKYRGTGGAIAVVKDGHVLTESTWGFADMDLRIPMTATTHLPICSISKQMICLVLESIVRDPPTIVKQRGGGDIRDQLDAELKNMLPQLMDHPDGKLTIADLYNMQSGIRDYWAMTTLWGARPDDPFRLTIDAPKTLERTRSFHFPPGTSFSYSNVNFHVLARIIERVTGQSLGQLLSERVFIPAGMSTTSLCPNTAGHPLPCVGYEGDEKHGYTPAHNRIEWSGDAGIVATLQDMVAYEKYLQASWTDPGSTYQTIAQPQTYRDGSPATYGHGLVHTKIGEHSIIGHGGALRGFRLHRMHCPAEKTSVVVLFNHEADAGGAAEDILKALLNHSPPLPASITPSPKWTGAYLNPQNNLLLTVVPSPGKPSTLSVTYAVAPAEVTLASPTTAESAGMLASIAPSSSSDVSPQQNLSITRLRENTTFQAHRLPAPFVPPPSSIDLAGEYHCAEVQSSLRITSASKHSGLMYGAFSGFMGNGPVTSMKYVAGEVWTLACPRGLDAPAPGDWTCVFQRGEDGTVDEVTIGCWLARNLKFERVEKGTE
ncbi:unnamed protein product [Zymoseptoria tritici ST99CH_1E4]|uniref:Beta-lactamase-related domain-containing protein n=1 Tax=Zymoseptoria tritici ST99CH_1E4 TaxID=1276532 RepID=A0A2H1FNA4_ZYMTR|nr:unnamed protein product [Zymoseptoria tritici ST99CH_1E4]